jgi:hypothetical protein
VENFVITLVIRGVVPLPIVRAVIHVRNVCSAASRQGMQRQSHSAGVSCSCIQPLPRYTHVPRDGSPTAVFG